MIFEHLVASCPSYNRKDYPHWIDLDKDCQDTRQEILVEENLGEILFKSSKNCRVMQGRWFDSFTAREFTDPRQLDVDHLVPLKEAHQSGAFAWSPSKRRAFANDLKNSDHLIAVASSANRSKGAKDPAEWLPPNQKYWRDYATSWTQVKIRWGLTADQAELKTLKKILGHDAELPDSSPEKNCKKVVRTKKQKILLTKIPFSCGKKRFCKEMKSCEEALFHLNECKRKNLDRNKDGVPCEKLCGENAQYAENNIKISQTTAEQAIHLENLMKVFKVDQEQEQIPQQGNNQIEMLAEKRQALTSQEKEMNREGLGEKDVFK
jgi:hypothetical protein